MLTNPFGNSGNSIEAFASKPPGSSNHTSEKHLLRTAITTLEGVTEIRDEILQLRDELLAISLASSSDIANYPARP